MRAAKDAAKSLKKNIVIMRATADVLWLCRGICEEMADCGKQKLFLGAHMNW